MKITFIGVGAADDAFYPNVSLYVETSKAKILMDCGTTVAFELLKRKDILLNTDAIYISHRHGDHIFGLPIVLLKMKGFGRAKPLIIFGYKGFKEFILQTLRLGYSTMFDDLKKFPYSIEFIEIDPKEPKTILGLEMQMAPTVHTEINYALKITESGKSIVYSGDGSFTEQGKNLYKGCDLLIHESFTIDEPVAGHAIVTDLIRLSKENGIKALALIHLRESVRRNELPRLKKLIKKEKINAFVPEPGTMLVI